MKIYDDRMDPECVQLCDAVNSIAGLETVSSCCGHGKTPFRIFFYLRDKTKINNLSVISRVMDRRYGGPVNWECVLEGTDAPEYMPYFCITSGASRGEKAYAESIDIAENMSFHLQHENFIALFGIKL